MELLLRAKDNWLAVRVLLTVVEDNRWYGVKEMFLKMSLWKQKCNTGSREISKFIKVLEISVWFSEYVPFETFSKNHLQNKL